MRSSMKILAKAMKRMCLQYSIFGLFLYFLLLPCVSDGQPMRRGDYKWNKTLHDVIDGATRIRVYSPFGGETLFEESDPSKVKEVISHIKIDEDLSGDHCMCSGNLWFEFYRDDEPIATLSFHHGQSLRWDGWPGDGELTYGSSRYLCRWLADYGIKGPLDERREGIVRDITSIPYRYSLILRRFIDSISFGRLFVVEVIAIACLVISLLFYSIHSALRPKERKGEPAQQEPHPLSPWMVFIFSLPLPWIMLAIGFGLNSYLLGKRRKGAILIVSTILLFFMIPIILAGIGVFNAYTIMKADIIMYACSLVVGLCFTYIQLPDYKKWQRAREQGC